VLINPVLPPAGVDVRFAPTATELLHGSGNDVMCQVRKSGVITPAWGPKRNDVDAYRESTTTHRMPVGLGRV